jgi:PKD repeat protein
VLLGATFAPAVTLSFLPGDAIASAASGTQNAPAIARGGSVTLVAWSDDRGNPIGGSWGETSGDIYAMRLDAVGNPLDAVPFPVTAAAATQERPKVAWNGTDFLVVFENVGLNGTGYYYQTGLAAVRVAPDGEVLDPEPIPLYGLAPAGGGWAIASDGANWVVVCEGNGVSSDIVAVRVSADGIVLDPPVNTLVPATYYLRFNLRLAYAGGVFLLIYNDDGTTAVRFDSDLGLLDAGPLPLLTESLAGLTAQGGAFYAVWVHEKPDYTAAVYGTRINTAGQLLDGAGDDISGANPPEAYTTTAVAWDGTNWKATWGSGGVLRVARISAAGTVLDPGGVAVSGPKTGVTAGTGSGGVHVAWADFAGNDNDVYGATVSSGNAAGPTRTLSNGAPRQVRSAIATRGAGYLVAYRSATAGGDRILVQPLDALGVPTTSAPTVLGSGTYPNLLSGPAVAWNGSLYLVAWGSTSAVQAQRVAADGTKVDAAPFTVLSPGFGPVDAAALGGNFLVAGLRCGYTCEYIFPIAARIRGTDGAVLDPTPLAFSGTYSTTPRVVDLGGRWLVVWRTNASHDDSYAGTAAAFVDATGVATSSFTVHGPYSSAGGNGVFEIGLASNGSVALMAQSQEITSGVETDLLYRFIYPDGTVSAATNLTPWDGNQYRPRIAWDGTYFVLVYQEQKNRFAPWTLDALDARSDIFGMRVTSAGTVVDPQGFALSTRASGETDPTVAAGSGVTLFAGSVVVQDSPFANYRVGTARLGGANRWPVAVATVSVPGGDVPLTVAFSSAGSTDPDGTIVARFWDFGDGGTSTQADPSHQFSAPGPYVVTLTVTDNGGAQTTQTVPVAAIAPNALPVAVASASPMSGPAPLDVTFYADGSYDPDGFVGNIEWQFSDGGTYWGSPAYHTFTDTGLHTAILIIHDGREGTGSDSVKIAVGGANRPPDAHAAATPTSGRIPLAVAFSSAGTTDPDGNIASYRWDFGDGSYSDAANPSHTYTTAGTYTATLTVTDTSGASDTATVTITAQRPSACGVTGDTGNSAGLLLLALAVVGRDLKRRRATN